MTKKRQKQTKRIQKRKSTKVKATKRTKPKVKRQKMFYICETCGRQMNGKDYLRNGGICFACMEGVEPISNSDENLEDKN